MDSKTLSQLKKDSDYIENDALKEMKALVKDKIELKKALKKEYNTKKLYWEGQERKAKQFIEKYDYIIKDEDAKEKIWHSIKDLNEEIIYWEKKLKEKPLF